MNDLKERMIILTCKCGKTGNLYAIRGNDDLIFDGCFCKECAIKEIKEMDKYDRKGR